VPLASGKVLEIGVGPGANFTESGSLPVSLSFAAPPGARRWILGSSPRRLEPLKGDDVRAFEILLALCSTAEARLKRAGFIIAVKSDPLRAASPAFELILLN